ncbi:peptide ABC transporter permease [Microbacterium aurum]
MTSVLPARVERGRVTWVRVEDGFHVASRAGEFVGFAERTADGHIVGFDSRSTPIGRYETLAEAQRAVATAPAAATAEPPMSRRAEGAFQAAATVAGMVAVVTLATAMTLPGLA